MSTRTFEGLEPLEPRTLLSADISPFEVHSLSASPDVSTIKITARRSASETSPTSRGMGQFTVTRSGGSKSDPLTINYTIDGTATPGDDYDALSGSVIIPAGKTSVTIDIIPVDDAQVEDVETVVLTLEGREAYKLGPTSTQSATVRIADNEPVVKIVASKAAASETDPTNRGKGRFTVTRSGGSTDAPLILFLALHGSANPSTDYVSLSGVVVIPSGQRSATIEVTPIDDGEAEVVETVTLTIIGTSLYRLGPESTRFATVRIADNEPTVKIATTRQASEKDPTTKGMGRFTVTRSGGTTSTDLAVYCWFEGSATYGGDYQDLEDTVVIPAGKTSVVIDVTPIADTELEPTETVVASLIPDAGYRLGAAATTSATVRIANVLAVDYASAMGMGHSEGTWRYDSLLRGVPGDFTRSVISASNGNYVYRRTFQSYDGSLSVSDISRWHVDEQAVSYVCTSEDMSELLGLPEGEMQTVQLPLSPRVLTGSFSSSVPLSISFDGIGTLSGSIAVTTRLVGAQTIAVPLGQFEAYQVRLQTKFSLKGTVSLEGDVRGRATTFTLTMDEKIWFVPDIGVVQVNETDFGRLFLAGYGTRSGTLTSSSFLASYDV